MRSLAIGVLTVLALSAGADSASAQFRGRGMSSLFDRFDQNGDGVVTSDELPNPRAAGLFERMGLDLNRGVRREEMEQAVQGSFGRSRGNFGRGGGNSESSQGDGDSDARSRFSSRGSDSSRDARDGASRSFGRFGNRFSNGFGRSGDDDQARERAQRLAERMVERYDQNSDGVLASDEIPDRLRGDLDQLDGNGDGILSAEELAKRYAPPPSNGDDESAGTSGQAFPFRTGPNYPAGLPSWFQQSDSNRDGQVAMYEWDRRQLAQFKNYDRNTDGFITADEAIRSNRRATGTTPTAFGGRPDFGGGRGGFGGRTFFGGPSFGGRASGARGTSFGGRSGFGFRGGGRFGRDRGR